MINKIKYKIKLYRIKKFIKKIKPIYLYAVLNIIDFYQKDIFEEDYKKLYDEIMKKYSLYKERMNAIPKEIAFKDI